MKEFIPTYEYFRDLIIKSCGIPSDYLVEHSKLERKRKIRNLLK